MTDWDPYYFRQGWDDYQANPDKAKACLEPPPQRVTVPRRVNGYQVKHQAIQPFYENHNGRSYLAGVRHAMAGGQAPPAWQPADILP